MAIILSSDFSPLRLGVFHIFLRYLKTQHTQPRGWKKIDQGNTDLGWLQAQEGWSLWAIVSVYSSKIPTKPPGTLTHPFRGAIPAPGPTHTSSRPPLTSVDCPVLSTSLDRFVLSTSVDSGTFLPSSSSGLVRNLARKPFMWVSRQNRRRNLLKGTYPHPNNECLTSCHRYHSCT